jgi:hypothetical protein
MSYLDDIKTHPHVVLLPCENIDERFSGMTPKEIKPIYEEWCRDNLAGSFFVGNQLVSGRFSAFVFHFSDPVSAVHFKLRWSGADDLFDRATAEPLRFDF